MAAASAAVTWRGLGAKTNPTASAPASDGQLRVLERSVAADFDPKAHGFIALSNSGQQFRQRRAGICLPHQALANQKRVKSSRPQARQILRCRDSALSHAHDVAGICPASSSEVSRRTAKVFKSRLFTPIASAPVRPSASSTPLSSSPGMHFNQHVRFQVLVPNSANRRISRIGQRGRNQKYRVGPMRARLRPPGTRPP